MQDRVPVNPGRVLITPENGSAAYYATMKRADNPTQEGTPLNKNSLLKDATAALFGLGADAVPDDVFAFLGKYNQHWWKRTFYEGKFVQDTMAIGYFMGYQTTNTVSYSTEVDVDSSGNVVLKNPATVNVMCNDGGTKAINDNLLGKYVTGLRKSNTSNAVLSGVYYVPSNAVIETNSRDYWGQYTTVYLVEYKDVSSGSDAVRSSDRNAYPDNGIVDGVEYAYLGVPFNNAVTAPKIATGSYTGTGTYGASNPSSLTLGFAPKVVFIQSLNQSIAADMLILTAGSTVVYPITHARSTNSQVNFVNWTGNGVSWWTSNDAVWQMNHSSTEYRYLAIG